MGPDREVSPEVIESCRSGDRDAIRVLYSAYKDRVYSIAYNYFHGDAAAAADVTQQVFLKVIRAIHTFRGDAAISTWIHRLAVNACTDGTRRRKAHAFLTDGDVLDAIVDPRASHEEGIARAEVAQSVQTAIASLPPKLRLAVLLRYFDDLSYAEMAGALGCSVGTVSSRLGRAHRMLAARLAGLRPQATIRFGNHKDVPLEG